MCAFCVHFLFILFQHESKGHPVKIYILAAALVMSSTPTVASENLSGVVTAVNDGDTLTVGEEKVRLWGISAPELSDHFGHQSGSFLREISLGSFVICEGKGESYNRTVARCSLKEGGDIGPIMVHAGWAQDWPKFSRGEYKDAQREARSAQRGIWRSPTTTPKK
jgi:endonuclease YncB( thermonuclease family)